MRLSRERFEQLAYTVAEEVLAELPPELRAEAESVVLEIAEMPTVEQSTTGRLLGLYEGVPLIERGADMVVLQPDRITLFKVPLEALARTEAELRHHVRRTLIHELGHFFGFDEDELATRGWS